MQREEGDVYVRELAIEEFRCIERTEVEFLHPDRPGAGSLELPGVNLLLGLNGGGKSTVLKAIVLGVAGTLLERSFVPPGWVRRGAAGECSVSVGLVRHATDASAGDPAADDAGSVQARARTCLSRDGDGERLTSVARELDALAPADGPAWFLAAYGPARLAAVSEHEGVSHLPARLQRVATLLDEQARLVPLEAWLPALEREQSERFAEVRALLDGVLPAETRFFAQREGEWYLFEHSGVSVPTAALSDGLRAHIAWLADLLFHLHVAAPAGSPLSELPGVVLVDEVDQRLHPRWQLDVLPTVAAALPRLQFLVTSHSPLLAGSLRPENLVLLEPDDEAVSEGATHARRLREDVFGNTADRVLTSSYFGLESSRSDAFRARLRDITERARAGDGEAALEFLRALGHPGAKPGRPG